MRRILASVLACLVVFCGCSGSNWFLFKGDFFELTIPPGFTQTQKTNNLLIFDGDCGKITLAWSRDQFSIKDHPAKEAVTGNPGDKILISEEQKLGSNVVWYSEVQTKDGWSVYLTVPLDRGELRIEAISKKSIIDIRQSVRSVVIINETYFSYPH